MSSESGHGGDSLVTIIKSALADSKRSDLSLAELIATYAIESGREWGRLLVKKYDGDQVEWTGRQIALGRFDEQYLRYGRLDTINPGPKEFAAVGMAPHELVESGFNLVTTGGWDNMLNCSFALATSATWASATCRIGVGTATAAAASGQVDLSAATGPTGRFFNLVTGNAVNSAGTGVRRTSVTSSFASGDANFAWAEWGIDRGSAGSGTGAATTPFLNRAVSAQGTKASPSVWTATANLDFV